MRASARSGLPSDVSHPRRTSRLLIHAATTRSDGNEGEHKQPAAVEPERSPARRRPEGRRLPHRKSPSWPLACPCRPAGRTCRQRPAVGVNTANAVKATSDKRDVGKEQPVQERGQDEPCGRTQQSAGENDEAPIVGRSRRSRPPGPAMKNVAAAGRPQDDTTPARPGSTRSSAYTPTNCGPPRRATQTVLMPSAASAPSRAATFAVNSARAAGRGARCFTTASPKDRGPAQMPSSAHRCRKCRTS